MTKRIIYRASEKVEAALLTAKWEFDMEVTHNIYFSPAEKLSQWHDFLEQVAPLATELKTVQDFERRERERMAQRTYRHLLNKQHGNRKGSTA